MTLSSSIPRLEASARGQTTYRVRKVRTNFGTARTQRTTKCQTSEPSVHACASGTRATLVKRQPSYSGRAFARRYFTGAFPMYFLNVRLNAASDSYPTRSAAS